MKKVETTSLSAIDAEILKCRQEMEGLGLGASEGYLGTKRPGEFPEAAERVEKLKRGMLDDAAVAYVPERVVVPRPPCTSAYRVMIHGNDVDVVFNYSKDAELFEWIQAFVPFASWCKNVDKHLDVHKITIQSADRFSPAAGFVKFNAEIYAYNGKRVPSIVFMRGGSVAMLPIITNVDTGQVMTILTKQIRVPTGIRDFLEIPAGMVDGSSNFVGFAAKELKEELGVTVAEKDLFDLTKFIYGNSHIGAYPSAGGCDEFIRIFFYERKIDNAELARWQEGIDKKIYGNAEEGEVITLKIIPFDRLLFEAPDMKALSALAMYAEYRRRLEVFMAKRRGTFIDDGLEAKFKEEAADGSL